MKNLFVAMVVAALAIGAVAAQALPRGCGPKAEQRRDCIPLPPPSCPLFKNCSGPV